MKKKFYLMMAVVMMLSVVLASGVFAATDTRTGSIQGYDCTGRVNCEVSGGSAYTLFGTTGLVVVALEYKYLDSDEIMRTITTRRSAHSTYVNTSSSKPSGSTESYSSKGSFEVEYSGGRWTDSATVRY